jgi:hypothetical protein
VSTNDIKFNVKNGLAVGASGFEVINSSGQWVAAPGATGSPYGATGAEGVQGVTGSNGTDGATGVTGNNGTQGVIGSIGTTGDFGTTGQLGNTGVTGGVGYNGFEGPLGSDGLQGVDGSIGTFGATGSRGTTGDQGVTGGGQTWVGFVFDQNYKGPWLELQSNNSTVGLLQPGNYAVLGTKNLHSDGDFHMFSIKLDSYTDTYQFVGIANRNAALDEYLGFNDGNSVGFRQDGAFVWNGTTQTTGLPTFTAGDVVDIAVDSDNRLLWIRVNGGNWNNDPSIGSGNITSGVGAIAYNASLGNDVYPAISIYGNTGGAQFTIQPTAAYTVPTGAIFLGLGHEANLGAQGSTGATGYIGATGAHGARYHTTSTTTLNLTTGATGVTVVDDDLNYSVGQTILLADGGGKHIHASVTSFNPGTKVLAFNPIDHVGSGSASAWEINLDGAEGAAGASGVTGNSGAQGVDGSIGTEGQSGITGATGVVGDQGTVGPTGDNGIQGASGSQGTTGTDGTGKIITVGGTNVGGSSSYTGFFYNEMVNGPEVYNGQINLFDVQIGWLANGPGVNNVPVTAIDGPNRTITIDSSYSEQFLVGESYTFTGASIRTLNRGFTGPTGTTGTAGSNGVQGDQGTEGDIGVTGLDGATGIFGATGLQGGDGSGAPAATYQYGVDWSDMYFTGSAAGGIPVPKLEFTNTEPIYNELAALNIGDTLTIDWTHGSGQVSPQTVTVQSAVQSGGTYAPFFLQVSAEPGGLSSNVFESNNMLADTIVVAAGPTNIGYTGATGIDGEQGGVGNAGYDADQLTYGNARGAWDAGTTYYPDDIVVTTAPSPDSHRCLTENTNYYPDNNTRNFTVTNFGSGAYLIDGSGNAPLSLFRGFTYILNVSASGHPFWIQSVSGGYSSGDVYNTGVTDNGTQNGVITFTVPNDAPSTLYYVCQYHSMMAGSINIANVTDYWKTTAYAGASGATGYLGATGFVGNDGDQGVVGDLGATGADGPQGVDGSIGTDGASGPTGLDGDQGVDGSIGTDGASGPTGELGITGATGWQGLQFKASASGSFAIEAIGSNVHVEFLTDPDTNNNTYSYAVSQSVVMAKDINNYMVGDITATDGTYIDFTVTKSVGTATIVSGWTVNLDGAVGQMGASGATGLVGASGVTGNNGTQGVVGDQGATGPDGAQGYTGSTGATGVVGYDGDQGIVGTQGTVGEIGDSGVAGDQGTQGIDGASGHNGLQGFSLVTGSTGLSTTSLTTIDMFAANKVGTAKYLVQGVDGSTNVQATQVILTQNNSSIMLTEYATLRTGDKVMDVTATTNGSIISLKVTPIVSGTTFSWVREDVVGRIGGTTVDDPSGLDQFSSFTHSDDGDIPVGKAYIYPGNYWYDQINFTSLIGTSVTFDEAGVGPVNPAIGTIFSWDGMTLIVTIDSGNFTSRTFDKITYGY